MLNNQLKCYFIKTFYVNDLASLIMLFTLKFVALSAESVCNTTYTDPFTSNINIVQLYNKAYHKNNIQNFHNWYSI